MNDARFAAYVDRFRSADRPMDEVFSAFAARDTAGRRFEFARELMQRHGLLADAVPGPGDYGRALYDRVKADESRRLGDGCLRDKDYAAALVHYTESVGHSEPGTERRARALAGRSDAMFRSGQYRLCVDDVRRAALSGYPAAGAYQLYLRAGNAECMLGRGAAAREYYARCLARLDHVSAEARRELTARVTSAMESCDGVTERGEPARTRDRLLGGRNQNIPALSGCVELKCPPDGGMGRGVYATCDINPGDLIAVDEPYVGSGFGCDVYKCYYYECSAGFEAGIDCPKCLLVSFCNEECMRKSYIDGHKLECPIMYSVGSIPGEKKINRLALKWFTKECSKMGIEKYCSTVKNLLETNIDMNTKGFDENGQFNSNSFITAFCLENNEINVPMDALFFLNCIAVEILHYLMLSGFEIPDYHLPTAGSSLVHMLNVLNLNSQFFKFHDDLYGKMWAESEPCALYPSICLFNHSCDPNVSHCSKTGLLSERKIVLKAIQPIPRGHQLFISYGPTFKQNDKMSRQRYLNRFLFKCACKPCLEYWPVCNLYPLNSLTSLDLLNSSMFDDMKLKCLNFVIFKSKTRPSNFHHHLQYLYRFSKLLYNNVKRPCIFYEDCIEMIVTAHKNIYIYDV